MFTLAGTVTFSVALWFYSTKAPLDTLEYGVIALVAIVTLFSIVIASKRIRDENRGLPAEDEFSKRVKEKAAAGAFSASFPMWTMILIFFMDKEIDLEIPVGAGILVMGLIFVGLYIYYSSKGIPDENEN